MVGDGAIPAAVLERLVVGDGPRCKNPSNSGIWAGEG